MKQLDKIRGSLIAGAAGDALGYAVEFFSEAVIFKHYGPSGIQEYRLRGGLGRISDDTQMTLFTANGLLVGTTQKRLHRRQEPYCVYIAKAYRDWYKTQVQNFAHANRRFISCWLMNVPGLYAERAPGTTCMNAIDNGCSGTIEHPGNDSKGCGGVMRVAPIGLYFDESWDDLDVDRLGAEAAALTHGHEMGYIPAALLVHIVRFLSQREHVTVKAAVLDGLDAMQKLFPQAEHLPAFLDLMRSAIALSEQDCNDLDAIHQLGEGWIGDEALAIAVYCALKYDDDMDKALIASVNHRGDSDSTGAITGNILGAHLGYSGIPEKYTGNLELSDVILELADDLFYDCPLNGDAQSADPGNVIWEEKYVSVSYGKEQ